MFKEYEELQDKLFNIYGHIEPEDRREWRHHPVTKAFQAELKSLLMAAMQNHALCSPTDVDRNEHIMWYAASRTIRDILDNEYFVGDQDEE